MINRRPVLGMEVSREHVAVAVLERSGRGEFRPAGWAWGSLRGEQSRAGLVAALLEEVGWSGGTCVLGLSLAELSLRHLELVFRDPKKIRQVLPLELEDQLIGPVEQKETAFLVTGIRETTSCLLVAAVEKEWLDPLLEDLNGCGLVPDRILVSPLCLAQSKEEDGIFVHGGRDGINLVVIREGIPLFLRRLAGRENAGDEPAPGTRADWKSGLAGEIIRSLDGARHLMDLHWEGLPLWVSGLSGTDEDLLHTLERETGLETRLLSALPPFPVPEEGEREGLAWPAFCLALAAWTRRGRRRRELDFLARNRPVLGFWTPRTLAWAAGVALVCCLLAALFLSLDVRRLDAANDRLEEKMRTIYRQTFPGAGKIVDPLVQMEARLRRAREPEAALPLFTAGRRCLDLLADLSARIPESVQVHVSRLIIDQEKIQIKGTTATFNQVDAIRNHLAASSFYDQVKIVSAAADKKKSAVRFELSLRLREAP